MGIIDTQLKQRKLPDVLLMPNGNRVKTAKEWEEIMRPYWKNMLLKEEYGKLPPYVCPEISVSKYHRNFAGKAVWENISFRFVYKGKEYTVPTKLVLPVQAKDCPIFISLNFLTDVQNYFIPTEEIIDNGFGVFSVAYQEITTDNGDFTNGLANLFVGTNERTADESGKIVIWAYMAQRMMDYLLTREDISHNKIGVIGHSRLGKTALLTAALDERFAFACVNESGTSGAALVRGAIPESESVEYICRTFPFWFCPNYQKYGKGESQLPFDQHALVSLIAPRAVFVGAAVDDEWADTNNQFLACAAASEVWKLYQKDGFITEDRLPEVGEVFTDGEVGFHLRGGAHYQSRADWATYMHAIKKHFNK